MTDKLNAEPAPTERNLTAAERRRILAAIQEREAHGREFADLIGADGRRPRADVIKRMQEKGLLASKGPYVDLTPLAYRAVGREDLAARDEQHVRWVERHRGHALTGAEIAAGHIWPEAVAADHAEAKLINETRGAWHVAYDGKGGVIGRPADHAEAKSINDPMPSWTVVRVDPDGGETVLRGHRSGVNQEDAYAYRALMTHYAGTGYRYEVRPFPQADKPSPEVAQRQAWADRHGLDWDASMGFGHLAPATLRLAIAKDYVEALDDDEYRRWLPVAAAEPERVKEWLDRHGSHAFARVTTAAALRAYREADYAEAKSINDDMESSKLWTVVCIDSDGSEIVMRGHERGVSREDAKAYGALMALYAWTGVQCQFVVRPFPQADKLSPESAQRQAWADRHGLDWDAWLGFIHLAPAILRDAIAKDHAEAKSINDSMGARGRVPRPCLAMNSGGRTADGGIRVQAARGHGGHLLAESAECNPDYAAPVRDEQRSPYAQVVRVHDDGRRVVTHPTMGWGEAREAAARINAGNPPGADYRFMVEPVDHAARQAMIAAAHAEARRGVLADRGTVTPVPEGVVVGADGQGISVGDLVRRRVEADRATLGRGLWRVTVVHQSEGTVTLEHTTTALTCCERANRVELASRSAR